MYRAEMGKTKIIRVKLIHSTFCVPKFGQKIASFFGVSVGCLLGIEENSAKPDTNMVNLDQIDVAFYGEFKELSEEDKETVRDMVRIMRERRAGKQRN